MNREADQKSRHFQKRTERKLKPLVLKKEIVILFCQLSLDIIASSLATQMATCMSWKPDPYCKAPSLDVPSPFCLIGKVLIEVSQERAKMILIAPTCKSQPWYATLQKMNTKSLLLLPNSTDLLKIRQENYTLDECKINQASCMAGFSWKRIIRKGQ